MAASLPYLAAPGSIKTAFERIRAAATPDRVTGDFVTGKLQMKGGSGAAIPPFLKKIGFVGADGAPTDLYKQFRNSSLSGQAVATSIKTGYRALAEAHEYFYELKDSELLDLIVQVTGAAKDSSVAKLTLGTLKTLKAFANFENAAPADAVVTQLPPLEVVKSSPQTNPEQKVGLNLSYTINLNLPATSDQAVFNAIFRSLREHLISNEND